MEEVKMKYCRRGWKDKILILAAADEATRTCSLKNEEGEIVVTGLPVVLDPLADDAGELPKSYATPLSVAVSGDGGTAPSNVAVEKVAEIVAKAKDVTTEVTIADLDRVTVPTLRAILDELGYPAPEDAKSKGLKESIVDVVASKFRLPEEDGDATDPIGKAAAGAE